jgi:cysteine desulfurase
VSAAGPIYLDCAATTAADPRVAAIVMRLMTEEYGNAGSRTHFAGLAAQREVAAAREHIALTLAAQPDEVIFTSGATESDNLAIFGLADFGRAEGRRHIVSTAIEHKAVLEPLNHLAQQGFEVTLIPPDSAGYVSPQDVIKAIRSDTLLVSVMHANNETGAIQPIQELHDRIPDHPFLHIDAAQSYGRETPDLMGHRFDLISISGHKIFGPKGIGALIARRRKGRRLPLRPLLYGGGQERGLRAGTIPVPLVAGFGVAAEMAAADRIKRLKRCEALRVSAIAAFRQVGAVVHEDPVRRRLANILSVSIPGVDSEAVMVALKGVVSISNGSACTSSRYEPSHVLLAMGLSPDDIAGTIRVSWSHTTEGIPWGKIVQILTEIRL